MISKNREQSMEPRTSLLAAIVSVVLLGCSTPSSRDTPSGASKGAQRSAEEASFSAYFVGKAAPFSSTTDLCIGYLCPVEIKVDAACNVTSVAVLNLGGIGPYPRKIMFVIVDSDVTQPHIFPPPSNNPPSLVVNKSGSDDPAFGTPYIPPPYNVMTVLFHNSASYPRRSHEYGINVKNSNTGVMCPTYDPWVIE
jgi:hypothetical protein